MESSQKIQRPIYGLKLLLVTDGTKVRQFIITSLLSVAAKTNEEDQKHDMQTIQAKEIIFASATYYDKFLTEALLKSEPRCSSPKR